MIQTKLKLFLYQLHLHQYNMSVILKLVITVATVCLFYRVYRCVRRWLRLYRRANYMNRNVPSVEPHWLWGNVFDNPGIFQAGLDWHIKAVSRCRRMLVYWGFWTPCLIVNHPDTMKDVLKSSTISRRVRFVLPTMSYFYFQNHYSHRLTLKEGRSRMQ